MPDHDPPSPRQSLAERLLALPALVPLKGAVFRGLWLAWLAANMTMWMNDVAAAWLMTSLTTSPVMVALVQTASTLPVFLLGIPSGALADIVDRRRYYAGTQMWISLVALVLAALALANGLTAHLLLALTFANGIGLALRWPVFAAIVPEVVSREHLAPATALNGVAMNLSRVLGPPLAGVLIAGVGPAAVFVLNAVLALVASILILRWRAPQKTSALPGERFVGAMRVGVQYVRASPRVKVVLLRVFLFFFQSTALIALLPLVALGLHGGGPGMFTVMLACLGAGAIVAAFWFPRLRARFDRDQFVRTGVIVHAAAATVVVAGEQLWIALPAMAVLGMSWLSVTNSLSISAQMALPNWVRARGMSIFQMVLMGGATAGSLVWGYVADQSSVRTAVIAAALVGVLTLVLTRRLSVEGEERDFSPVAPRNVPEAVLEISPDEGPVMVTVEYQIDPARAAEFVEVMQLTRRARLRLGVLSWALFKDAGAPGRYVEYFVDESWLEHLRRHERFSVADEGLRERRHAFHVGDEPPRVRRLVAEIER
jgi:MFS family permease